MPPPPLPPVHPVDVYRPIDATGGEASAFSSEGAGEAAAKAFDNDLAARWHTADNYVGDEWLQIQLDTPASVAAYKFLSRPDDCCAAADSPHAWTLEGSNDGSTWTALHAVLDEQGWGTSEWRTYYLPNAVVAEYEYYKWTFPAAKKGGLAADGSLRVSRCAARTPDQEMNA